MSETQKADKYADWWATVFRTTQLCIELKQERDEARRERDEAISKLKFAQNELFTILRFQEDEKREHRNLLERLSFFQNRFESMRAERDQAMSDLEELREEQKEEAK